MHHAAIPEDIAAAIKAWADGADGGQLTEGPTLADLGGAAAVTDSATDLAASPWFLYLIDAAGKAERPADAPADMLAHIDSTVVNGFLSHERPSSYASATARLLRYPRLAERLDRHLERALLARVIDAASPTASARAVAI